MALSSVSVYLTMASGFEAANRPDRKGRLWLENSRDACGGESQRCHSAWTSERNERGTDIQIALSAFQSAAEGGRMGVNNARPLLSIMIQSLPHGYSRMLEEERILWVAGEAKMARKR